MKTPTIQPSVPAQPKTVNRSTFYLSLALTFFVTLVITFVGAYFTTINMIGDQRAQIVQDMQVVSKTVEQK